MQRHLPFYSIVCILLLFSFNYTFPLHRNNHKWKALIGTYINKIPVCDTARHRKNVAERNKKTVSNIESTFRKIKESTQDLTKNINDSLNVGQMQHFINHSTLSDDDLRHYEQLVIMKKYPYLDLKELEYKYSSSLGKNIRQSAKYVPGSDFGNDPSICEPAEDGPVVEIFNRGLSGFAIPPQLTKHANMAENKIKYDNFKRNYKHMNINKTNNFLNKT